MPCARVVTLVVGHKRVCPIPRIEGEVGRRRNPLEPFHRGFRRGQTGCGGAGVFRAAASTGLMPALRMILPALPEEPEAVGAGL